MPFSNIGTLSLANREFRKARLYPVITNSLSRSSNRNQKQEVPEKSYYALNREERNTQWREWKRTLYKQCPIRLADRLLAALDRFNKYGWNISDTSRRTRIPIRTLFRHQAELRYYGITRPVAPPTSAFAVCQKRHMHKELRYSKPLDICDSVETISTLESSIQPKTAPAETQPPEKILPEKAKPLPPAPISEEFWQFCAMLRPLLLRCGARQPLHNQAARGLWELAISKLPPHYALNHLQLYKFLDQRMTPRRRAIDSAFHYAFACIRNDWPKPRQHWHAAKPPAKPRIPEQPKPPPAAATSRSVSAEPAASDAVVHETFLPGAFRRTAGGFFRLQAAGRERKFQAEARQQIAEHFRQDKPDQEPDS